MTTTEFIQQHRSDDVRQLAFLAAKYPDVDAAYALDQIRGWQIAKVKLPKWSMVDGLQYPPHLSMEQCSSETTADYKAAIAQRLLSNGSLTKEKALLVDITGGFGVDFSYMASALDIPAVYVERNPVLCELARHNFPLLNLDKAEVVCGDGEHYAQSIIKQASMVYMDPARRDVHGARTYGIEDCTPNILELLPLLMPKTRFAMVKLSPMLDWHSAVAKVNDCLTDCFVAEIHIVSLANECKDLLLVIAHDEPNFDDRESEKKPSFGHKLRVVCVNGSQEFSYCPDDAVEPLRYSEVDELVGKYLFEPNASIMKAGCFQPLVAKYGVSAVGRNSHLFLSEQDMVDFPGRRFVVEAMSTMNKKELRAMLSGMSKANIATRNFPLSVAELRRRLKLKDGGDLYLFATTLADNSHVILVCKKAK